jgi:hypothetical protein
MMKRNNQWHQLSQQRRCLVIVLIVMVVRRPSVRQVTQGVGHEGHESIDDANYDGDLATYMRK